MEESIEFPNPKLRFIGWLFGPLIQFLEARQISVFLGAFLLFSIVIYFIYFRGITKGGKINWQHTTVIVIWLGMLILAVLDQIDLLHNSQR